MKKLYLLLISLLILTLSVSVGAWMNVLFVGGGTLGSWVEVETEADYTEFWWSGADGQSWFGGDNLGVEAIDDSDNQDFADGTINEWVVNTDGSGTLTYSNAAIGGTDDKQALLTAAGDEGQNAHRAYLNLSNMSLSVSTLYKIVVKFYVPAGNTLKTVRIGFATVTGDIPGLSDIQVLVGNAWTTVTFYNYFAADISGDISIKFEGEPTAGDLLYFDDISIKPVTSPAIYASTGAFIRVCDSDSTDATDCASGYIGEVGTGETLGEELLNNPSFDVNVSGWSADSGGGIDGLLASIAGGVSNNSLRVTENGNGGDGRDPFAYDFNTTVANKAYQQSVWVKQGTESTYRLKFNTTTYSDVTLNGESTATWVHYDWYAVAFDTSESMQLQQIAATTFGTTIFFDEASWKEVTEPNPNSVKVYKEEQLANEGWTIGATFDPNDISTFTISQRGAGDYCSGQSWNTFTDYRLDFDHTTDDHDGCISGGTERATDNASPTVVACPNQSGGVGDWTGSDGNCLLSDANSEHVVMDNTGAYFDSKWGELMFSFMVDADNTGSDVLLEVSHDSNNRLRATLINTGGISILWEDNSKGNTTASIDLDIDIDCGGDCYDKQIQVHIKWDTTACTAGSGNCEDGPGGDGDNELGVTIRVDANGDGDFGDGGREDWEAWTYDGDTEDLEVWVAEPGDNDITFGVLATTYSVNIWIDDLQISNSQPASMEQP